MDFVNTGLGDGICAGPSEVKAMLIASCNGLSNDTACCLVMLVSIGFQTVDVVYY